MTAQSIMQETRELHELNVELMDTLLIIGQRLVEHADKHGIVIDHRDSLALLIGRAQRILALIGTPYRGNPIIESLKRDVTKSKQNQESLQKMDPSNSYPPSAVRRFFGPARKRFS